MAETTTATVEQQVGELVTTRVLALQTAAKSDHPGLSSRARADLAQLRQLNPGDSTTDVRSWQLTLSSVPPELQGRGDTPGVAERAIHSALVLYATHAQSAKGAVQVPGVRLGRAVRDFADRQKPEDPTEAAIVARFHSCAQAATYGQLIRHLRGLVTLLRSEQIPLDYGLLAQDLYRAQQTDGLRSVRLRWGRSFHSIKQTETPESENTDVR